jgi:hypothetical protein
VNTELASCKKSKQDSRVRILSENSVSDVRNCREMGIAIIERLDQLINQDCQLSRILFDRRSGTQLSPVQVLFRRARTFGIRVSDTNHVSHFVPSLISGWNA